MTTVEFLTGLQRRNVHVWVENDSVRCRAPREALTPELREQLASRKAEILALLGGGEPAARPGAGAPSRIARDGRLPLSYSQERLWFLYQLMPESAAYNIVASVRFGHALDVDALRRSLDELVRRHETLRTTFATRDGEPVLQLHPPSPVALSIVDLHGDANGDRDRELARVRAEHAGAPFDLERGPLMRVGLARHGDGGGELLLAFHHIIADRWSVGVVTNELQALYRGFAGGSMPSLPDLTVQYVDFAAWQREHLASGVLETQLAYWRDRLAGLADLDVPADRPRPSEQTYAGAWESRGLADLSDRMAATARLHGVTPFMIMLAGFSALLHRYTAQTDIAIGTPISGRTHQLFENVVGCFLNMLVLRTDVSGNPTFEELLRRIRGVALDAYEHADVPFEKLVADLQPRRDTSRSPLFQVALSFQSASKAAEMPVEASSIASGGTLFDLTLFVTDTGGQLTLTAEYNVDLFERSTIARMLAHLETLLRAALEQPSSRIGDLPLLTEPERHLLAAWNATDITVSGPSVHGMVSAQAARTPDAVAVSCGGQTCTYAALEGRSNQLARYLRRLGVAAEAPVGICVDRSIDMFVGLLGIMKAGAAYVPLDPAYPAERLAFMLDDAGVRTIVTQEPLLEVVPTGDRQIVCLDRDRDALDAEPASPLDVATPGESLAYIIYTSGSTGRPKGVQVPHRAVVNFLNTMAHQPGLDARDVLVAVTTLSFDIAALEMYLPLTRGGRVVVATGEQTVDGHELKALLFESGATALQATPATWGLLLEAGWTSPGLKMLCGGEALPRDLATALLGRGRELWNLYGPTETTIWSCVDRVGLESRVSIGRPIANTQTYVLDPRLRPLPAGIPGELYIAGEGLARGYRGRPDLTAERFVPNPFGRPGERMYRTGDIARHLPDGRLECLGRVDHQVKVRGFRIELGEVETALVRHARVKEALVLAEETSPGDRRLVAYIVCRSGQSVTASDLRRFVRTTVPEYMVPSFFVTIDRVPRLPNGKIDRRSLPGPFQAAGGPTRTPPRTPTERRLADIWRRTLGIPAVSADDNFFDVGGHSLLSMRVVAAIETELGCRLSPRVMFLDSLRQIAARCDRQSGTSGAGAAVRAGDAAAAY